MDSDKYKNVKQSILSGAEMLLYIFIGIYFYKFTSKSDIGIIVWFVGISLVINRNITNYLNTNSHELTDEKINVINERIDVINERIDVIGQVIDIEDELNYDLVSKVCDTYLHIPESDFKSVKRDILNKALERLVKIRTDKSTDLLSTSEYYTWLLDRLEKATKDYSIRAVSCMLKAEWNDSPLEQKYIECNLAAAKKGVNIERIFVTTRSILNESSETDAVISHARERRSKTQLMGFFVDVDKLYASDESELLENIGDGYIIFESISTRVAVIDVSEGTKVRGTVIRDENRINNLEKYFERLKMISSDLSISLIDNPDLGIDTDKKRDESKVYI